MISVLVICKIIIGIFSGLGCCFIVTAYLCYKALRSFPYEQVVCLVISSFFSSLSYLFFEKSNSPMSDSDIIRCHVQAFTMVWFENSQYIFATLIGYCVYQSVVNFEENSEMEVSTWSKRLIYMSTGYLIPLVGALSLEYLHVYGESGQWCWINTSDRTSPAAYQKRLMSSALYWIMWILIILNFAFHFAVYRFLFKEVRSQEERELFTKIMWKLVRFPIIQVVCILPGTVNRLFQVIIEKDIEALQIIHLLFQMLQGTLFAIAYGYTEQVRKIFVEQVIHKFCCCSWFRNRGESDVSGRSNRNSIGEGESEKNNLDNISQRSVIEKEEQFII